jgi:RNA polymerase sigma-70 factor (ECF subfamily)
MPTNPSSTDAQQLDELRLLRQAQDGVPEAFRALIEQYQRPLYDLARRMLRDPDEAQDVTQDTFIRLHRHLPSYKVGHSLRNWLYTITLNLCRNRLRRKKLIQFLSFDFQDSAEEAGTRLDVPSSELGPEGTLEEKEAAAFFDRLLDRLPAALREVVILKYLRSYSDEEIASILEISVNHVRVRLSRAKAKLWNDFGKEWHPAVISEPGTGI